MYRVHEQLLAEAAARDAGDLIRDAVRVVHDRPSAAQRFAHVLVDDAHDLDLASATLARAVAGARLTMSADPVRPFRGSPLRSSGAGQARALVLKASLRVPHRVMRAAGAIVSIDCQPTGGRVRSPSGAVPTSGPRPRR